MGEASNDDARAKSLNRWAIALMVLAFAAPFLAAGTDYSDARKAGERLVYVLFGLAVFGSVAGIVTPKGGAMAKSKARFLVGILLLVGIGSSIAVEISDVETMKTVMRQMLAN